jgi:predicted unusual protein kinase regulating ubiquinone biosynthesis (AarF/ABC1/UbiB family)
MAALPEPVEETGSQPQGPLPELLEAWSMRPVPVGWFRRLRLLGTMQAKIGAAYAFHWLRGWFKDADENKRLLAETHWRTAVRILDTMSYLRGATMKVGQMMGNFPDIAPQEFTETLEQLHFEAPPMHWSLLKEMVFTELQDDPENVFAAFEKRAFAAASLGQVHRARLKTGEELAVKIQYPGIDGTIRDDVRNLLMFMLPARLSRDWDSVKEQFEDLRIRLERETDYEQEAAMQQRVRALFREDDGIVVPRVFPEHSSARVITMDYLEGKTLDEFVATNPSQELRNEFARKILRAWYRMLYASRLVYVDIHPGNFLFLDDGRLGVIDFGMMLELDETLWEQFRLMDRPLTTGNRDDRIAALNAWQPIGDGPAEAEQLRLKEQFWDWNFRARSQGGEFDFGDEADFRRGIELIVETLRKRCSRSRPCTPVIIRETFGLRSILYRLRAKIDVAAIAEEDIRLTGWDRSDYAPASV